jgi:outer membrane protein OmpA-like peptidoglycan-associated protein/tetratricopeptide (TPR) repeat protein
MRKNYLLAVALCLATGFGGGLLAQSGKLKKARQLMETLQYEAAVEAFQPVMRKKAERREAIAGTAEAYRRLRDYKHAEQWYAQAIALPEPEAIWFYYYGLMLLQNGYCEPAQEAFNNFLLRKPYDARRPALEDACGYRETLTHRQSQRVALDHPGFNGPDSDLGPAFYDDGLVFGSVRRKNDNLAFYDLYYIRPQEVDPFTNRVIAYDSVEVFSHHLKTEANQAIVTFNEDGTEMYFTRNQAPSRRDSRAIRRLEVLMARQVMGGLWGNAEPLAFNSPAFSCAHPALSADGQRLFFTSDRPGGFGGKDIYVCLRSGDTWGDPINLGPGINTEGDELYPYYHAGGELYFASDGRPGLGGQDIYRSEDLGGGNWGQAENLGYPINTSADDFGLIINATQNVGYFTSNRPGGAGKDDIYYFRPKGVVLDVQVRRTDGRRIDRAVAFSLEGSPALQQTSDDGRWQSWLPWNACLYLISEDAEYRPDTLEACARHAGAGDTLRVVWTLQWQEEAPEIASEPKPAANPPKPTGKVLSGVEGNFKRSEGRYEDGADAYLLNVYYDSGRSSVKAESVPELWKMLRLVNANPDVIVEISSHTDAVGSNDYNQRLSQRRADAIVRWLAEKGVDRQRLVAKGYGETLPVNDCRDGINCTEAQLQANRRTEFRVLGIVQD